LSKINLKMIENVSKWTRLRPGAYPREEQLKGPSLGSSLTKKNYTKWEKSERVKHKLFMNIHNLSL